MHPKTFIFIGRSGSGKGTQARLIQEWLKKETPEFEIFYLETGTGFRKFFKGNAFSHTLSQKIYKEGGLQPAFLAVWMWSHLLIEKMTGKEHLIIDGTPRKAHEAPLLDEALRFYERKKPYFVYLNVGEEWARKRLHERGRSDDRTETSVNERMEWFKTDVLPAVEFFRKRDGYHFLDINGEQGIDEIHKDIVSHLTK